VHKYRPDQDKTKREFLDQWVKAVNEHGGFGKWDWAVSRRPGDVTEIIERSCDQSRTAGTGNNL
jgi:type III restriction enzyme